MAQYKIQQGDTLSALARKYGTSVDALMQMNPQIQDRDLIYYDRMMTVPGAGTPPTVAGTPPTSSSSAYLSGDMFSPETLNASESGNMFADAFGSVKDYIAASRQEQLAKEQQTGTATGIPVIEPPKMQARSQEGQPTIGEIFSNVKPPVSSDPFQVMSTEGPSTIPTFRELLPDGSKLAMAIDDPASQTLKPIKESVVKSATEAGEAVNKIIQEAPDAIKGSLSSFANNEVAAILAGINKADKFIKDDMSFLMEQYSKSIKKKAGEGAESFAKNIGIIRKDFVDNLSNFAQDNNLDMQSLVEAIDVDALYNATGIRNKKKEQREKIMKAKLDAERSSRIANLQNQNTSRINTMMQPTSAYAKGGLAQQAKNVAAQGRYGDSMLLHVNPAEVAGLSQVMPLTINPETGQPEAFLPFLLPLLGSIGGSALAGSSLLAGTALAGKAALLGAIGSGLGTYAATGDAKKGLMSGLMGYGLGTALGAGAKAAKAGADAATTATASSIPAGLSPDDVIATMGQPVTNAATTAATQPTILSSVKDIASAPKEGLGGFFTQMSKPSSYFPTYIGAAGYGMMNSQEEFNRQMENLKANDTEEYNRILAEHPEYVPMLSGYQTYRGGRRTEQAKKEFKPTAAVEARDINPFFMAGFQPEVAYLKNLNPSSAQIVSGQSGYAFGTEGSDMPAMTAPFDPTQTAGYQSFYNAPTGQPYSIDPFQKQTFERGPAPVMPDPVPVTEAVADAEPNVPIYVPPTEPAPAPSRVNPFNPYDLDIIENVRNLTGISAEGREESETGVPMQGMMDVTAPPMVAPTPIMPTNEPIMMTDTSGLSNEELESGAFNPALLGSAVASPIIQDYFAPPPPITTTVPRGQDRAQRRIGRNKKAEGGSTDFPDLTGDGKVTRADILKGRGVEGFQEGGLTQEAMSDPVTQEVVKYISGESGNDQVVSQFVNKYGSEAFMQLREMVLQQMSGGQSQTEGLISGSDMGGMTDDIPMTISGGPAAVSQGEYIVPADVVSGIGDGDTESGASILDDMLDNVRMARTGTTKQAPRLANVGGLMPA